jgi:hypothetical protein
VVHLDVKPANVLLSFEGEVKLTDFGVARSRAARQSEAGITGTIPFMSPEQARGDPVDLRSDVFSTGVLLYALLTGSCPFGEEDTMRTVELLRKNTPAPPPAELPEADAVAPLLAKALAPTLEKRFATAGAFADAIEETMYYRAWRSGAAALGERVRQAFPEERMRLNALFAPGTHVEGLNVAHPADSHGGTLLSRIPDAVSPPVRQTQVADTVVRPRHRLGAALFVGAGVGALALAAGGWALLRTSAPTTPDGWELLVAMADAGLAGEPDAASAGPDAATVPRVEPPPPAHPRIERPVGLGTLTVNANPWGTVTVNGKPAGTTPLLSFPVRAGMATVVVENPKLSRKTIQVKIHPGKDTPLIVDLRSPAETR